MSRLAKIKGYIGITKELVASYLDTLGAKTIQQTKPTLTLKIVPPITIAVDKKAVGVVLEGVIRADVENWHRRGPYTELRQCWEKALGSLPKRYQTEKDESDLTQPKVDRDFTGIRIYRAARELDTALAQEYISANRSIDLVFIVKLYQMLDSKLRET